MSPALPKRKISDTENRLVLLCCLEPIESATAMQLWQFVADLRLMEYIPMQLTLHELMDSGEVESGRFALKDRLFLSQSGRRALSLFGGRVPASVHAEIAAHAPAFALQMTARRHVEARYELAQKNDYHVLLSLREGEIPIISLRLHTNCSAFAETARERFASRTSRLLLFLYSLEPSAEVQGGKKRHASITTHSLTEYTLAMDLPVAGLSAGEQADFQLSLLLPSKENAEQFSLALAQNADAITQSIFSTLCQP